MIRINFPKIDKWLKIVIKSRYSDKIKNLIDKYQLSNKITVQEDYNNLYIVIIRIDDYSSSQQMISEFDVGKDLWVDEFHMYKYFRIHNFHTDHVYLKNIVFSGDVIFQTGLSTLYETMSMFFDDVLIKINDETSNALLKVKQYNLYQSIINQAVINYQELIKSSPSYKGRSLERLRLWMNMFISKLEAKKIPIFKVRDLNYKSINTIMK
ncbi:MAG: hypothetical protein PHC62_06400 [Candidatus Izemoplasmatales bacterium]|jgi:hypothetical protein|nr:hypothetical protein [Candidatus Izemoplasmatales bacterium]